MQLGDKKGKREIDRPAINVLYKPIPPTKSRIDSFHAEGHL